MKTPLRLLMVEDSANDAELILRQLHKAGYQVTHTRVETPEEMQAALGSQSWDLITADYQLPQFDAAGALFVLKETQLDIPFMVISGAIGEETAVEMMRSGACDYLMKDKLARLAPAVERELIEARNRHQRRSAEGLVHLQAAALNAAANAVVITDCNGTIEWVNPAFTTLTGYEAHEAIGKNLRKLVKSGRHDQAFYQEMWDTILSGSVWHGEIVNQRKDGQIYYEEQTITPVRDPVGQTCRFIAVKQDISARKHAEESLFHSQEQYRFLVELSPDAIFVNRNNRIEFANPAALELFGADRPEQLLGKTPFDVFHPDYHPRIVERIRSMVEAKVSVPMIEEKIVRLDGSIRDVEVAAAPFTGATGDAIQVILRDITERKQAELLRQETNEALETAYNATLQGWSSALELRERETAGHSLRVVEWTINLARAMGIGEAALVDIYRGALLHDIGKMAIPDNILLKPGPLTNDEWEIMRKHPVYAYTLLSKVPYLKTALDIPYHHHEHWDGSGYPTGLKGEEIPFAARVFAVIDVWDALSYDRPYRAAWSQERIVACLKELSGKQFDPSVVEKFLELIAAGDSNPHLR